MGMSTHITGFKPADEKWKRMKRIWDACGEADIKPPKEVSDFFEGCTPDPSGVKVDLKDAVKQYHGYAEEGYEVHIDELPKDVKIIRFWNAW